MKLERVKVDKLFDLYTYNLNIDQENGLTFLTGPNGYGKTTILSIINSLYSKNFYYYLTLTFESITLYFEKGNTIKITKKSTVNNLFDNQAETPESANLFLELLNNDVVESTFSVNAQTYYELIRDNRFSKVDADLWEDRADNYYSTMDILESDQSLLDKITYKDNGSGAFFLFINSLNACFIKERRLTSLSSFSLYERPRRSFKRENNRLVVEKLAYDLKGEIDKARFKSWESTRNLNESLPERLLSSQSSSCITRDEYEQRKNALNAKLLVLKEYGLLDMKFPELEYTEENKRILTFYLSDIEEKATAFDDILPQLKLFVQIMDKKKFTSKRFCINGEVGFSFKSSNGRELKLQQLSSGEQHEVILIYNLLFNARPDMLVLIDEPEISLHVAWQHEFITDMMEIAKMRKLTFIIATHSPQIIGNQWDLCHDLYEMNKEL